MRAKIEITVDFFALTEDMAFDLLNEAQAAAVRKLAKLHPAADASLNLDRRSHAEFKGEARFEQRFPAGSTWTDPETALDHYDRKVSWEHPDGEWDEAEIDAAGPYGDPVWREANGVRVDLGYNPFTEEGEKRFRREHPEFGVGVFIV